MKISFIQSRSSRIFGLAVLLQLLFIVEFKLDNVSPKIRFCNYAIPTAYNIAKFSTPHIKENIVVKGYHIEGDGIIAATGKKHFIQDTIGYPVLLGLLWKCTGSYLLYDIIFFQIIIFSLLLVLFDQALIALLHNKKHALGGVMGVMFYLPFCFFNTQPVRDVYLFYGILLFWIAYAYYFSSEKPIKKILIFFIFFALCQWIRSPLFGVLIFATFTLPIMCRLLDVNWRKIVLFLTTFWFINIGIFWIPFMTFNKITYDRYFVGCTGQALLEGLGEFKNKWGFKLSDVWYDQHISALYPSMQGKYGTPEFDDVGKDIAMKAIIEDPYFFLKNMIIRIPHALYWALPCFGFVINYQSSRKPLHLLDKLIVFSEDLGIIRFFLFFISRFITLVFVSFGILGLGWLLYKRNYNIIMLWIVSYIGSLGLIISHLEIRYLYPVIPLWGIPAGVFFAYIYQGCSIKKIIALFKRNKKVYRV